MEQKRSKKRIGSSRKKSPSLTKRANSPKRDYQSRNQVSRTLNVKNEVKGNHLLPKLTPIKKLHDLPEIVVSDIRMNKLSPIRAASVRLGSQLSPRVFGKQRNSESLN